MSSNAEKLRIALVTAYPPAQGRSSEYGWHLAQQLSVSSRVAEVHVLADRVPGARSFREGNMSVERCWTFDSFDFPAQLARSLAGKNLNAVWFNIHLTSTGRRRLRRFFALCTPAVLRLLGYRTVVTLHHLPDLTDLSAAGISVRRLDLIGASAIVRLLGCANRICLPLPEYAELAKRRYRVRRARFIPLGTPGLPPAAGVARDPHSLLAFGRFGSYKRLEVLLEAVGALHRMRHPVRLHVAGSDSVYSPGYLSFFRRRYAHYPNITFHGYVPEGDVPGLFQRCAAAVLPYRTVTGASSVALQAAMYGTALLAADVPGLHLMGRLGLKMTYLDFDDAGALAAELTGFFAAPSSHARDVKHNLAYCSTVRMADIVDAYLDEIEGLGRERVRTPLTAEVAPPVAAMHDSKI